MIKRILLLCLSVLLVFTACLSVSADSSRVHDYDDRYSFTDNQYYTLENKLDSISQKYNCEVVVFTVNYISSGMKAEDQANACLSDYLESKGLASDSSSICLLVCMNERKYGIYAKGEAYTKIFKSSALDRIEETIKPYLSDGDVYGAFDAFADDCEDILYRYNNVIVKPLWIVIALGIGIIIAFIVVLIMKSQLKSVRYQPAANNYLKNGSLNVTEARDIFLFSTITRTEKPKSNSSSSGSSSSGGGRSGSF